MRPSTGAAVRLHRNAVRNRPDSLSAFKWNACPPSPESAIRSSNTIAYLCCSALSTHSYNERNTSTVWSSGAVHSDGGFILGFEIQFDLHIIGVAQKNLPTSAIGHLVLVVGHAFAAEVLLHSLEAPAAKRDMIDDA
jgi:hypothetical protein